MENIFYLWFVDLIIAKRWHDKYNRESLQKLRMLGMRVANNSLFWEIRERFLEATITRNKWHWISNLLNMDIHASSQFLLKKDLRINL